MNRKINEIKAPNSVPLLEGESQPSIEIRECSMRRRNKLFLGKILFFLSTVLCIVMVAWAPVGNHRGNLMSEFMSNVVNLLGNVEFMNLSGGIDGEVQFPECSEIENVLGGLLLPNHSSDIELPGSESPKETESLDSRPDIKDPMTFQDLYAFNYENVPYGETPIIPMDLSLSEFGNGYINNATGYKPDTEKLLAMNFGGLTSELHTKDPLVLIVHTHGTEAYCEDGALSFLDQGGDIARSNDAKESVVSVGGVLAGELNRLGVNTIHCTMMHDQIQYKDSYSRSEQTIRKYLQEYPSIRLVIDLHRDSILKSGGELVRPVTLVNGEATAQVMCVVGSDWNGSNYSNWEKNLSLALKVRELLNQENSRLCRPVYLKASTYNQEIAPYSLLLEVGASGNSLEEAKRAAEKIAETLLQIIPRL